MTGTDIIITILSGILVNIFTGVATYALTSKRDKEKYIQEQKDVNERIADIAVNHLLSSYKSSKKTQLDVRTDIRRISAGQIPQASFSYILDGIARSLEQGRMSLFSNMQDWKHYLNPEQISKLEELSKGEDYLHTTMEKNQSLPLMVPPIVGQIPTSVIGPAPVSTFSQNSVKTSGNSQFDPMEFVRNPEQWMMRAYMEGDINRMNWAKSRFAQLSLSPLRSITMATILVKANDRDGIDLIVSNYEAAKEKLDLAVIKTLVAGIISCAYYNDLNNEVLPFIEGVISEQIGLSATTGEDKAFLLNELAKINHYRGDFSSAIQLLEQVVEIDEKTSYLYNLAMTYDTIDDNERAAAAIHKMLQHDTRDTDHLSLAITVLRKHGDRPLADQLMTQLQSIDPFAAKLLD